MINPLVTIRLLEEKDIEALGALHFPWATREETVAKWSRYFEEQKKGIRQAYIVEQRGEMVGYGHLLFSSEYPHFRSKRIPEISDLWIFEEYREQGIGTFLIAYLEKLAAQKGYSQIGIGVGLYRDYGSAQRLYVQLGYMPDGEGITYKHIGVIPGEKFPVDDELILWLAKTLSPS